MFDSRTLMVGDLRVGDTLIVTRDFNYDNGHMTAKKGERFEVEGSSETDLYIVINDRKQVVFFTLLAHQYLSCTFGVFLDRGRPKLMRGRVLYDSQEKQAQKMDA